MSLRAVLCASLILAVFPVQRLSAQPKPASSGAPVIRVTSSLVFLDVTVLDKKGRPVVKGLTQDDFTITEGKKPQRIFSFEAPGVHVMSANSGDDNPEGKAPVTIFALDLLNSGFEDFAYIRYEVRRYLAAQPRQLKSPAELMVLGNRSLEMLQGYTRSKEDLLYALNHLPPALPYKLELAFWNDRFSQSYDALQQIALQNKGVPGRKNIIWVGHGGPGIWTAPLPEPYETELKQYVHETVNMLVDARVSLFVIYPGLKVEGRAFTLSEVDATVDVGDDDPFAGNINFGVLVNETGGRLFYNRNDVDGEIRESEQMGSEYYTLTYPPPDGNADGRFRRIRVTVRNPKLRAVTKDGYYAQDRSAPLDPRRQTREALVEGAESTIPFAALDLKIAGIVRHPDTRTADLTVQLKEKNVGWHATGEGKSTADLLLAGVCLTGHRSILASKVEEVSLSADTQDPVQLAALVTSLTLTIRIPRKTQSVRVVLETAEGGRMGAAEVDRRALDASPEAPTPEPQLTRRPPNQVVHAGP